MCDKPKPIKHRNLLKKFFITFPKSNISKTDFADQINQLHEVTKGICVEEKHEDKTPHLHLGCEFKTGISKNGLLQKIINVYPNDYKRIDIQSMKSWDSTVKYLTLPEKEKYVDQDPYLINFKLGVKEKTKGQLILHKDVLLGEISKEWCLCWECVEAIKIEDKMYIKSVNDVYYNKEIEEMSD